MGGAGHPVGSSAPEVVGGGGGGAFVVDVSKVVGG